MSTLRLAYRRVLHAIDNHGVKGTALRVIRRIVPGAEEIDALPRKQELMQHPFDRAHGVETSGYIPGERLGATPGSGSDLYNTAYYGISPSTLRAALEQVPIAKEEYTFVDLGCGKGRALLVAAEFPFRKIIGVDLDAELCAGAAANVASSITAAGRVQVLNEDALALRYPPGPLLIYMYHPFLAALLRRVLAEIKCQYRSDGREVYLLFANAIYFDVIAQFAFLEKLWDLDLPLSEEDAAADRHGTTAERYTLYRAG